MRIFVTAKLVGQDVARQGWFESFTIVGQSGLPYVCEDIPVKVINPPEDKEMEV